MDLVLLGHASWCLNLREGFLGDVAGFGPIGTRLLVPKSDGGIAGEVVGFGPVGTCLLRPKESTLPLSSHFASRALRLDKIATKEINKKT